MSNAPGFTIGQVSELLGVPVPTLRSWHLRYGVALPERTAGGHRRYQQADLLVLQEMSRAVSRGIAPRTAAQTLQEPVRDAVRPVTLLSDLLDAAVAGDQHAVDRVLEQSRVELGVDDTVQRLLVPALRELGARWELGQVDVGVEHLATTAARRWVARQAAATDPERDDLVLLAAAAGNEHTVALEAFEVLLRVRGCSTRQLGANTPVPALLSAVLTTGARAVVVTAHQTSRSRSAVEALALLSQESPAALFFAGAAFDSPRRREGLPGSYLGTALPAAADVVLDSLSESAA